MSATTRNEPIRLGLRGNLGQFALLVGVNALVGGMVGQERSVLPLLATDVFGVTGVAAVLTYLVAFGVTKAGANLLAGALADRFGRKPVLVAGWLIGLPVPLLLIWAPAWDWIVVANVLLGLNQGLTWSTTVIMKIDLVGPARRGLAMGLNEAAGYGAVALTALVTGAAVDRIQAYVNHVGSGQGLRPEMVATAISDLAADDAVFTNDTGMCNVWGARYLRMKPDQRLLASFRHGSMANALPQAIGATIGAPDRQVVAMCGDGGFSMLLGELLSLGGLGLPVKVHAVQQLDARHGPHRDGGGRLHPLRHRRPEPRFRSGCASRRDPR
jgi:MFS family permease